MRAKDSGSAQLTKECVERLAEIYKKLFALDNARNILLSLAQEYQNLDKLAEATDSQYGCGCSEYVAKAILDYYGV